jgi:hypothetical protein
MFRRIEFIYEMSAEEHRLYLEAMKQGAADEEERVRFKKFGLLLEGTESITRPWIRMPYPRRRIERNCRFYLTEEGWRRYGRPTIRACQRVGRRYRVIAIKEKSVDVIYRDEAQVAVRPRKKRAQAA